MNQVATTALRLVLMVLALAVLAACTIPSLETLSRRQAASAGATGITPPRVIVRSGDTVYGIARRFRQSPQAVIDVNGLRPPYTVWPGQTLLMPRGRAYTVRAGDSLYGIARNHDIPVADLARANGLRPPHTIYVGQQLAIPRRSTTQVAAATPAPRAARTPAPAPAPAPPVVSGGTESINLSQPPLPPRRPNRARSQPSTGIPIPPRPPSLVAARAREAALPAVPAPRARSASGFQWPLAGRLLSGFGVKANGLRNDGVNIAAERGTPVVAAENGVVAYAGNELRGYGNLVLILHDDDWATAYGHAARLLVRRGDQVRAGQRIAIVGASGPVATPQLHFEIRRGTDAVNPLAHLPPAP